LPIRRASMKFWAAAALISWIALWMMVYRGKRRQRKTSESALESDLEGLARSTTTQGVNGQVLVLGGGHRVSSLVAIESPRV